LPIIRSKAVSIAQARQSLSALVNRVAYGGERIVLTRHGRNIAAIVPMNDLLRLAESGERDARGFLKELPEGMTPQQALVEALERELESPEDPRSSE